MPPDPQGRVRDMGRVGKEGIGKRKGRRRSKGAEERGGGR